MTIMHLHEISELSLKPLPIKAGTFQKALLLWYQKHKRPLPWRELWERHHDPYHIWVSEIMLQQTVIKAMIPVYQRFLKRYPSVFELAAASEEEIKKTVQGLGYYRRFRMMHQACQQLLTAGGARQSFVWPTTFDAWKALPGIGDYTAAAVTSIAFDVPEAVVDGNVERVLCRLLDIRLPPNLPALKKQFKLIVSKLIASKAPGDFNQAMMELGQTICTVQAPACQVCPLRGQCQAYAHASTDLAPQAKVKKEATPTLVRLTIVTRGKQMFGLYERPASAKFLKETPGFVTELSVSASLAKPRYHHDGYTPPGVGTSKQQAEVIGRIKHSITNHRITAEVMLATHDKLSCNLPVRWYHRRELGEHLIANLDRKAWHLFEKVCAARGDF